MHLPKWIRSGRRAHILGLTVKRDGKTASRAMWTDFLAQSTVGKTIVFKIWKNATQYRQVTMNNVWIIEMNRNHAMVNKQEVPSYEIVALCESIVQVEKDGVTPTAALFYGIDV